MKFHSTKETFKIMQTSTDVIILKTSVISILQYSLRGKGSKAIMEFAFETYGFLPVVVYTSMNIHVCHEKNSPFYVRTAVSHIR